MQIALIYVHYAVLAYFTESANNLAVITHFVIWFVIVTLSLICNHIAWVKEWITFTKLVVVHKQFVSLVAQKFVI